MEAVWIAALAMVSAVLIVNLGLGEAIAQVSGKILQCPTCLTFWGALAALLYHGTEIVVAVSLSILSAYLSNFAGIILMVLNKWYERLWQRNNRQK